MPYAHALSCERREANSGVIGSGREVLQEHIYPFLVEQKADFLALAVTPNLTIYCILLVTNNIGLVSID